MAPATKGSSVEQRSSIEFVGQAEQLGERFIVRVPEPASLSLPSRGQVAMKGSANGRAFDVVLEPDGRKGHWLPVPADLRDALSLSDGEEVPLALELADQWPEPAVPNDLQTALDDASDLDSWWAGITPMARWEWVRWIGATKNPATREKRVQVSISKLRAGKRRPCCFDLSSCTDPELSKSGKLIEGPY